MVWSQEAGMSNMFWVVQKGRPNVDEQGEQYGWPLQPVFTSEQVVFGLRVSTKTQIQKLTWQPLITLIPYFIATLVSGILIATAGFLVFQAHLFRDHLLGQQTGLRSGDRKLKYNRSTPAT